jgi:hypothetical protein
MNTTEKLYNTLGISVRAITYAAMRLRMLDDRYHHCVFNIESRGRQGNAVDIIKEEKVINFHSNEAEKLIYTKGLVTMHTCAVDLEADISSLIEGLKSAIENVITKYLDSDKFLCFSFDSKYSHVSIVKIMKHIKELKLYQFNVFYNADSGILTVFN